MKMKLAEHLKTSVLQHFHTLIGANYAAKPDEFNFVETNNQDLDLNTLGLRRNTNPI